MVESSDSLKVKVPVSKPGPPPRKRTAARLKQAQRASMLLKHVSDPTRLQVILTLSEGEQHVGALCGQLNQSQPAVSHHLALCATAESSPRAVRARTTSMASRKPAASSRRLSSD